MAGYPVATTPVHVMSGGSSMYPYAPRARMARARARQRVRAATMSRARVYGRSARAARIRPVGARFRPFTRGAAPAYRSAFRGF